MSLLWGLCLRVLEGSEFMQNLSRIRIGVLEGVIGGFYQASRRVLYTGTRKLSSLCFKILQGFSWGFRIHGVGLRVQD